MTSGVKFSMRIRNDHFINISFITEITGTHAGWTEDWMDGLSRNPHDE